MIPDVVMAAETESERTGGCAGHVYGDGVRGERILNGNDNDTRTFRLLRRW